MKLFRLSVLSQICMAHLISHVYMLVLPVLMPIMLITDQKITFVQIGIAISVFNIVSAVVQLPMGILVDKLGPKRVLMAAVIIGSICFLSLGFIHHYIWLVISMGIIGIANAVYHPADYAILSQNVGESRMGRSFSLHTFSGMAGFAITPAIMLTVASTTSVSMAFIVSGLMGIVVALMLYPNAKDEPVKKITIKSQTIVTDNTQKVASHIPLMNSAILLMLVLFFLLNMSSVSIQNFSVSALVMGYSITLADANIALTVFLIASSIGVLAGGQLADYSKKHGLVAAGALVITALFSLILALFPISSIILITIIIGIMGFLSGMIAPSRDMLVKAIAPKGAEGRVFGIVSTGFSIGGAVAPILFGWVLDHGYPKGVFGWAAAFMIMTALIAIFQELKGKSNLSEVNIRGE